MHFCKIICVFLCASLLVLVHGKVTDKDYASMPPLFHLDNFDNCMLLGENSLYCSVTAQLAPIDSQNYSDVWRTIREVIKHEKNYRHDRLRHGICVAQTCPTVPTNISDNQLLKNEISECYADKYKDLGLTGFVTQIYCESSKTSYAIDTYDVSVGLCFFALFLLVTYASYYEGTARYKTKEEYDRIITNTKFGTLMACFSIPKNWQRLGSSNTSPDADSLKFVNGMRFYTMFLIVMAHTCMAAYASPVANPQYAETITDNPLNMLVVNGSFAVQTFLALSAWLLSYHFFLTFEGRKEVKISYILLAFVNRYFRLTPCLLAMIAFNGTWLYHMDKGPSWDRLVGQEYRNCRANWWTNLLYINNYYDEEHICMEQSWYLATDTQLFLVSLVILIFLWKYQKHIKAILTSFLILGVLIPGIVNYIYDFDIVIRQYPEALYSILLEIPQFHIMYASGYTNLGAYAIGLIAGYIFYKNRGKQLKIFSNKFYIMIWWILTFGLPLTVIYVGIPIYKDNYKASRLGAAVYVSLARHIYVTGICIGMYGLSHGVGWFLRDAVTWKPLQVLGRLTYCVYLVHTSFIRVRGGQMRSPLHVSSYFFFTQTLGDLTMAYTCATFLCLFVEMPSSALQKMMVPQLDKKRAVAAPEEPTSVEIKEHDNHNTNQDSKM